MFKRGVLIAEIALAVIAVIAIFKGQIEVTLACVAVIGATMDKLTN